DGYGTSWGALVTARGIVTHFQIATLRSKRRSPHRCPTSTPGIGRPEIARRLLRAFDSHRVPFRYEAMTKPSASHAGCWRCAAQAFPHQPRPNHTRADRYALSCRVLLVGC